MTTKSAKRLRERGNGFRSVKSRRRMNAKKAVRTDRGRVKGMGMGGWA